MKIEVLKICLELSNTKANSQERLSLLNGRDADDKTPLVHAVENGRGTMAAALLTAGAPPLFHGQQKDTNRMPTCLSQSMHLLLF